MEYALAGEGPVALVVHGAPGGYGQCLGLADMFTAAGLRVLRVSGPGYPRRVLELAGGGGWTRFTAEGSDTPLAGSRRERVF
jgi:hypothetical protein